ncbi:GAP family protein [Marmoricola sp. URHB0036]|uniref:GAP family protein n=1 Tax=Marmoricola sp. URHB0036 TaxID=1298863 RepID=UPI000406AF98|nr:GAP family protein [Marmoricola sp. URHB0036]
MGKALLQLLPLALASALSTVTISATIFFLLSKTRTRSGLAFLTGTVIGTFAAVTLAAVAGQALPGRPRHHHDAVGKLEVVLGIAMVVLGLVSLARRHRVVNSARRPGWLHGISDVGPVPVFGIGLALNLRPKAVLLAAAAGLVVSDANLAVDKNLALLLLYTVVATSTVGFLVVGTTLSARRMEPRLVSVNAWMSTHSRVISATIMIMVGVFVAALGLTG